MHLIQIILLIIIIIIIIANCYYQHWKLWFNSYFLIVQTIYTLKQQPDIFHNKDVHITLFVPHVVEQIHMMSKTIFH